jgi:guanylate kinase
MAHLFNAVIPNHDGEDSENWDAFYYPLGDARKSLRAFVALLRGEWPDEAERWEPDLLS